MVLNPLPNEPLNPVIEDPVIEDPVIEIPHQNETEVVNTQKLDLVDQGITLSTIKLWSLSSVIKWNSRYWLPTWSLATGMQIYSYNSSWGDETLEYTQSFGEEGYTNITQVGSKLMDVVGVSYPCFFFLNVGGTSVTLYILNWDPVEEDFVPTYYTYANVVSWVHSAARSVTVMDEYHDVPTNMTIFHNGVSIHPETRTGIPSMYHYYNSVFERYQYVLYDGVNFLLREFYIDGSEADQFSTLETLPFTGGSDWTSAESFYFVIGSTKVCGWKNHLWYYENATVGWKEIKSITASYPTYNLLEQTAADPIIHYCVFGSNVLEFAANYIIKYQLSTSHSGYTAWDDYFIDTDKKVWKLEYAPMAVENDGHKLYEKYLQELDQVIVTSETAYIENQYMINADDADIEIFEGYIDKITKEAESSVIIMEFRSEVRNELNQRITGTWTQMTPQAILADIISDNFKWLSGLVGTSLKNTITTLLDLAVTNLPFWKICQMFDDRFTYITHLNPNNVLYWDIGAAPSPAVTFTDTDELAGPDFQGTVVHAVYPIKFAIIELWGSVQDGLRTHCIYKSDGNYGKYEMSYPDLGGSVDPTTGLVTSGPLYDQAVGLSANKNQSLVTLRLSCFGKGRLKIGDIVLVTQSQFSITAQNFYVYGNIYDGTIDACVDLYLQSAIYPPADLTRGVDEQSNEELILMNAKEINDVRNAILFNLGLYLTNTASVIAGTYKQFADTTPVGNSTVNAVISSASGTLIEEWITETAPGVLDFAVGDIIEGHLFVYVNALVGNKTCLCYYEVYRRTAGGTETKFATSSAVFVTGLAATIQEVEIYGYVDTAMILAGADYLVVKIYGKITGTGSNPTLYISYGATYHSHFGVGIQNTHLSNNFLRLDGTKTMTGQIKSSLAIGTAPMVIVSTTTVANLSVDHTKASNIGALTHAQLDTHVNAASLETTWTDSDTKYASSKGMKTKADSLIAAHAGALTHAQLDYLKYFCRLRKNQTQTISNATTTRIIWDTNDVEVEDTYDMHTPSGTGDSNANCRIYAPVAGLYEIQLKITFNTITASQVQAWIRINAETTGDRSYMGITSHNEAGGVTSHLNVVATIRLAANECIEGWVYQGSGGNGTIISIANVAYTPTAISVKWVGP